MKKKISLVVFWALMIILVVAALSSCEPNSQHSAAQSVNDVVEINNRVSVENKVMVQGYWLVIINVDGNRFVSYKDGLQPIEKCNQ